jgi:multidrug efflux pump subunit AcrA (membrane-fusion protein)
VERATGAVQHAQAELSNRRLADLELQRTSAEVALRTIKSPVNGVVVERYMHPGEFPKQEKILKLAQIDPLRVEVYVPVAMLGKIVVGRTAYVKPESPVTGEYAAKVTVVDRVVDAASGTFGVRLELPNHDLKLPAGLKCTVRFGK